VAEFAAGLVCSPKEEIASKPFGNNVENLKNEPLNCDSKG
jgi:hypothetical protein